MKIRLILLLSPLLAAGLACSAVGIGSRPKPTETEQPVQTEPVDIGTPTFTVTPTQTELTATSTPQPVRTQTAAPANSNFLTIAAGSTQTCALKKGGGVICWGNNSNGQLGDGTTISSSSPVAVTGLASGVTALTAGAYHTCALLSTGAVKCWGYNYFGQLGNGLTADYYAPVSVEGLTSGVTAIAAGVRHTCALASGGGVKCWGNNLDGQLGDGTTDGKNSFVDVSGLDSGVTDIAAGDYFSCGVTLSGGVKCWGDNQYGQLGDGTTTNRSIPVDVVGLASGVTAISAGESHACALLKNGGIMCWGDNLSGQLGDGTQTNRRTPVEVSGLVSAVTTIAAGGNHTCAVMSSGEMECWGNNWLGQLGDGTRVDRSAPTGVTGLTSGITEIAVGMDHTCALVAEGESIKCWGWNSDGQLGNGAVTWNSKPVALDSLESGVITLATGDYHTCAVVSTGGLECWGYNGYGQLGDGTSDDSSSPVKVIGLGSGVTAVAAGYDHTCALFTGGGVKCWGDNEIGQLGDETTTPHLVPVAVSGLSSGVAAIAAGNDHTCALTASGGVKCWGANGYGQLGDGTTTDSNAPVDVTGLTGGVSAITVGYNHTCALSRSGGVKCWGDNQSGQLGDDTKTNRTTPVDVSGLNNGVAAIAAGYYHTCALLSGGGIKCWGANSNGELGDGSRYLRTMPVDVDGLTSGVVAISAGLESTCALVSGGGVNCWGSNTYGQLGDGTTTWRSSPVNVNGLASGVTDIATGGYHTCVLVNKGQLKCWGDDSNGQLGSGRDLIQLTPETVVN